MSEGHRGATFFTETSYSGEAEVYPEDEYGGLGQFDDKFSSAKVSPGCTATVHTKHHFGGEPADLIADMPPYTAYFSDLGEHTGQIKSLRVTCDALDVEPTCATCTDCDECAEAAEAEAAGQAAEAEAEARAEAEAQEREAQVQAAAEAEVAARAAAEAAGEDYASPYGTPLEGAIFFAEVSHEGEAEHYPDGEERSSGPVGNSAIVFPGCQASVYTDSNYNGTPRNLPEERSPYTHYFNNLGEFKESLKVTCEGTRESLCESCPECNFCQDSEIAGMKAKRVLQLDALEAGRWAELVGASAETIKRIAEDTTADAETAPADMSEKLSSKLWDRVGALQGNVTQAEERIEEAEDLARTATLWGVPAYPIEHHNVDGEFYTQTARLVSKAKELAQQSSAAEMTAKGHRAAFEETLQMAIDEAARKELEAEALKAAQAAAEAEMAARAAAEAAGEVHASLLGVPLEGARFFTNVSMESKPTNFSDGEEHFGLGEFDASFSSATVLPGCQVSAYTESHFEGLARNFPEERSPYTHYFNDLGDFKGKIKSLKVSCEGTRGSLCASCPECTYCQDSAEAEFTEQIVTELEAQTAKPSVEAARASADAIERAQEEARAIAQTAPGIPETQEFTQEINALLTEMEEVKNEAEDSAEQAQWAAGMAVNSVPHEFNVLGYVGEAKGNAQKAALAEERAREIIEAMKPVVQKAIDELARVESQFKAPIPSSSTKDGIPLRGVRFYTGPSYTGESQVYPEDEYAGLAEFDGTFSSARVYPGCRASVYTDSHHRGFSNNLLESWSHESTNFPDLGLYKERVLSIKVECDGTVEEICGACPECEGCVVLGEARAAAQEASAAQEALQATLKAADDAEWQAGAHPWAKAAAQHAETALEALRRARAAAQSSRDAAEQAQKAIQEEPDETVSQVVSDLLQLAQAAAKEVAEAQQEAEAAAQAAEETVAQAREDASAPIPSSSTKDGMLLRGARFYTGPSYTGDSKLYPEGTHTGRGEFEGKLFSSAKVYPGCQTRVYTDAHQKGLSYDLPGEWSPHSTNFPDLGFYKDNVLSVKVECDGTVEEICDACPECEACVMMEEVRLAAEAASEAQQALEATTRAAEDAERQAEAHPWAKEAAQHAETASQALQRAREAAQSAEDIATRAQKATQGSPDETAIQAVSDLLRMAQAAAKEAAEARQEAEAAAQAAQQAVAQAREDTGAPIPSSSTKDGILLRGARFYTGLSYTGDSEVYSKGEYSGLAEFDNKFSSAKVYPGCQARVYTDSDHKGFSYELPKTRSPYSVNFPDLGFYKEKVTSVKVQCDGTVEEICDACPECEGCSAITAIKEAIKAAERAAEEAEAAAKASTGAWERASSRAEAQPENAALAQAAREALKASNKAVAAAKAAAEAASQARAAAQDKGTDEGEKLKRVQSALAATEEEAATAVAGAEAAEAAEATGEADAEGAEGRGNGAEGRGNGAEGRGNGLGTKRVFIGLAAVLLALALAALLLNRKRILAFFLKNNKHIHAKAQTARTTNGT